MSFNNNNNNNTNDVRIDDNNNNTISNEKDADADDDDIATNNENMENKEEETFMMSLQKQQQQQQQEEQEQESQEDQTSNFLFQLQRSSNDDTNKDGMMELYTPKDLFPTTTTKKEAPCLNCFTDDSSSSSSLLLYDSKDDDERFQNDDPHPPPCYNEFYKEKQTENKNDNGDDDERILKLQHHVLNFILHHQHDGTTNHDTEEENDNDKNTSDDAFHSSPKSKEYKPELIQEKQMDNNNDDDDDETKEKESTYQQLVRQKKQQYKKRRMELRNLATKIHLGGGEEGARIDVDGRLIPILPPQPQPQLQENNNNQEEEEEEEMEDNPFVPNNNNNNLLHNPQPPNNPNDNNALLDLLVPNEEEQQENNNDEQEQEQRRILIAQEEEMACSEIQTIMDYYNDLGIYMKEQTPRHGEDDLGGGGWKEEKKEDTLQFVPIDHHRHRSHSLNGLELNHDANHNNGALRQLGFALSVIFTMVIGVLYQLPFHLIFMGRLSNHVSTFTNNRNGTAAAAVYDPLLYDVLETRDFREQIRNCYDGSSKEDVLGRRDMENHVGYGGGGWEWLFRLWWQTEKYETSDKHNTIYQRKQQKQYINCADGVLHIPSVKVLQNALEVSHVTHHHQLNSTSNASSSFTNATTTTTTSNGMKDETHSTIYEQFKNGVNLTWFFPCSNTNTETPTASSQTCVQNHNHGCSLKQQQCSASSSLHGDDSNDNKKEQNVKLDKQANHHPPPSPPQQQCFRGVHDNLISQHDVKSILHLASDLISNHGGDHVNIHFLNFLNSSSIDGEDDDDDDDEKDIISTKFQTFLPKVLSQLSHLFQMEYGLFVSYPKNDSEQQEERQQYHGKKKIITPVAFRINAALPMDRSSSYSLVHHRHVTSLEKAGIASLPLVGVVNETMHEQWENENHQNNDRSHFTNAHSSLPLYSFLNTQKPYRDPCILMSDLQAHPSFAILTSISLSSGAGEDFSGGTSLFINENHHQTTYYNSNSFPPRKKLRRGLSIDGSVGRVVVSTGGDENKRCRMPMRSGIRAVLQIWWGHVT